LRFDGRASLIAARLETGRTHQIRVHLAWMGHPVQGDSLYATAPWREGALQLHAAFLAFDHPVSGNRISIFAGAPHDFVAREVAQDQVEPW
jgi:23S rRNA pseudouridine1911/1915/1917 synthase